MPKLSEKNERTISTVLNHYQDLIDKELSGKTFNFVELLDQRIQKYAKETYENKEILTELVNRFSTYGHEKTMLFFLKKLTIHDNFEENHLITKTKKSRLSPNFETNSHVKRILARGKKISITKPYGDENTLYHTIYSIYHELKGPDNDKKIDYAEFMDNFIKRASDTLSHPKLLKQLAREFETYGESEIAAFFIKNVSKESKSMAYTR